MQSYKLQSFHLWREGAHPPPAPTQTWQAGLSMLPSYENFLATALS